MTTTNEDTTTQTTTPDPATAAATTSTTTVATEATGETDEGSLLEPAKAPASDSDWLPEKFRVNNPEGKLDESASARKMAESYKALEAHKGPLPSAPATPDDYVLEIEGFEPEVLAGFKADPLFQAFAKDAHAEGMSNKQLNMVLSRYMKVAPDLIAADAGLQLEDARAELSKVWKDEATMNHNLAGVVKAIQGFGAEADDVPGSRARLMSKYGRDPDFIAFAASVAGEMKEDGGTPTGALTPSDIDAEALQRSEAYWKPEHPDHAKVKAQVESFYTRKYGTKHR